jgi:membrane-associated phospholipid phosphatase
MDGILDWGVGVIVAVQSLKSGPLTAVMKAVTLLGSEYFYLLALPFLFWCFDERKAFRLGIVVFVSLFLNCWLKVLFAVPRPYIARPDIGLSSEATYSLPSNHAQGSLTLWGVLAGWIKKPWGLVLAVVIPCLVGFTRVYLGVHYPTDILAGWAVAGAVLLVYYLIGSRVEAVVGKLNIRLQVAIVAIVSWVFCALYMQDVAGAGAFFGMGIGYAFCRARLRYDGTSGAAWKKLLRLVLGMAVLLGLYLGLKAVFPGAETPNGRLFRFLRYALLGGWVAFGSPAIFIFLKLADARPAPAKPVSGESTPRAE